jgi:hypothetical protein
MLRNAMEPVGLPTSITCSWCQYRVKRKHHADQQNNWGAGHAAQQVLRCFSGSEATNEMCTMTRSRINDRSRSEDSTINGLVSDQIFPPPYDVRHYQYGTALATASTCITWIAYEDIVSTASDGMAFIDTLDGYGGGLPLPSP